MSFRRRATVLVLLGLIVTPIAHATTQLEQLATQDVVVGRSAELSASERNSLVTTAASLADTKPTKFLIRGEHPSQGREIARQLREQLTATTGFTGTLLVVWQRPTRGLGIAGPFPQAQGQRVFEAFLPSLKADPIAGAIQIARALAEDPPDLADPTDGALPPDDGVPFAQTPDSFDSEVRGLFTLFSVIAVLMVLYAGFRAAQRPKVVPLTDIRGTNRLDPLVDGLAALISEMDIDSTVSPNRHAAANDHGAAVLAYGTSVEALPKIQTQSDVDRVAYTLQDGIRAAKRARAILDGTNPPHNDEPLLEGLCTFDPKHGLATTSAPVTGPNGGSVTLRVCGQCAAAIAADQTPTPRTVRLGDRERPYWTVPRPGSSAADDWLIPTSILGALFGTGAFPDPDQPVAATADHWSIDAGSPLPSSFDDSSNFGGASGGDFGSSSTGSDSSSGSNVGGASGGDF